MGTASAYAGPMDRKVRREYLERLADEIGQQRKIDVDQLLLELIRFATELDDQLGELEAKVG